MKERVAEIVATYIGRNTISPDQLPALIESVNEALSGLEQQAAPAASPLTPAVSVRRSVGRNKITCLECGWSGQMLKRHLMTAHRMTPEQYRERWKLAHDYPMVAPNYASRRSELAKSFGLGKRRG
jgi:predicted transcriptional regulator